MLILPVILTLQIGQNNRHIRSIAKISILPLYMPVHRMNNASLPDELILRLIQCRKQNRQKGEIKI